MQRLEISTMQSLEMSRFCMVEISRRYKLTSKADERNFNYRKDIKNGLFLRKLKIAF